MTETGSGAPDDLIGVDEASALLEVTPDRVEVMVEEGLLTPVGDGDLRFRRVEVLATQRAGRLRPVFVPLLEAPGAPDEISLVVAVRGNRVVLLDCEPSDPDERIFLGTLAGRHCWAVDVDVDVDAEPGEDDRYVDLRMLWGSVDEPTWMLAGRAVQLVEWRRTHQYCGRCGVATADGAGRAGAGVPELQPARVPASGPRRDHARRPRRRAGAAGAQRDVPARDLLLPLRLRGAGRDARARRVPRGAGGGRARGGRRRLPRQPTVAVPAPAHDRLRCPATGRARSPSTSGRSRRRRGSRPRRRRSSPTNMSIAGRLIDGWRHRDR